ncbi:MAG: hypothetical protein PUG48_03595 [Clostridia bacterium]|nr:hypothetical protein [Clostridia bacterium]
MKKKYKFVAVFSAVLMSAVLLTACSGNKNQTSGTKENSAEISHSQSETGNNAVGNNSNAETEISHESSSEEISDESSAESSETSQDTESSVDSENSETSEKSENSENTDTSDTSEKSDTSESDESSEQPPEESEDNGYYFDDEQIVDDYHTATEFTDNEAFNKLFSSNKIDRSYQKDLQEASTISQMRAVTSNYAEVWKAEEEKVYKTLYDLLKGENREAKSSLEISEQEWKDGIQEVTDEFYAEIDQNNGGSEELLSADTAVMNYYKGRAAKLYEQVYQLTGKFDM